MSPGVQGTSLAWAGVVVAVSVSVAAAADNAGKSTCPCIEWAGLDKYVSNGKIQYEPVGAIVAYPYPGNYGNMECKAHDAGLEPMCNYPDASDNPAWCSVKWCYVDKNNCDLSYSRSRFFPNEDNVYYSYATCTTSGSGSSSFEEWELSDVDGTTMLMDLLAGYLRSSRTQIEEAFDALNGASLSACGFANMCPCTTCSMNTAWDKKVDFTDVGAVIKGSGAPRNLVTCLVRAMGFAYQKVAEKEADPMRVGYQYFADQATGSYVGWPNLEWCPAAGYDPKFRPWYASGTTGPKDVVIVVDVSGSMGGGRDELARKATLAILDTLTWKDYASIILFDGGIAGQFSDVMVPVSDQQRAVMKGWVNSQDFAQGTTDFKSALFHNTDMLGAFPLIEKSVAASASSMCQKIIMFLTDGTAGFSNEDYNNVRALSTKLDVSMFTYALGSGADTTVTKNLACQNRGIFYKVPDNGDLSTIMAGYYQYFAEGQEMCTPSFVEYQDAATGTQLYAGCLPMYGRLGSSPELLGVTCNDINMLGNISMMKQKDGWTDMICKMSDMTKQCRSMDMNDCKLEKLRLKVGGESCGVATQSVCPCADPSCQDVATFKDAKGYFCDTWIGDQCTDAYGGDWGYSAADMNAVRTNCKRSCGICPVLDPCPKAQACSSTRSAMPTQCRACQTDKVSGIDMEGCRMNCGQEGRVCDVVVGGSPSATSPSVCAGLLAAAMTWLALARS